jgi:hypothetical protein
MRLYLLGLVSLALAGTADAEGYPSIVVDRPLVLDPGMTELDAGVEFPTYQLTPYTNTALGDYRDFAASAHHAFGPTQVGIAMSDSLVGPTLSVGPRLRAGAGAIDIDVGILFPTDESGIDHEYMQSVRYTYKAIVAPHVFALWGGVGIEAQEGAITYYGDYMTTDVHLVGGVATLGAELQLVDELELGVSVSGGVPLSSTNDAQASGSVGAGLTYVFDRFDVSGSIALNDLREARLPYAAVNLAVRFGG